MNKERVVVSGINGFVGHHLAKELSENNISVIGIGQDENLAENLESYVDMYYSANLTASWPTIENVDGIIHLAGLAAVGPSFDDPQLYINTNSGMVTNLCEFYLKQDKKPRIVIVSSGAIYDSKQEESLNENSLVGFNSPYAVSKVLAENQAAYYRARGLDCIITRPFNHIGPGQGTGFIIPDLYKQIIEANNENVKTISTGNLTTRRDYTDVRDIVKAYTALVLADTLKDTVYNVSSGRSVSGDEILEELKKATNSTDIIAEVDQTKIRPNDIPNIIGDSSRIQTELGWKPQISLDQTIRDFVTSV